jgi:hypothetical protein
MAAHQLRVHFTNHVSCLELEVCALGTSGFKLAASALSQCAVTNGDPL